MRVERERPGRWVFRLGELVHRGVILCLLLAGCPQQPAKEPPPPLERPTVEHTPPQDSIAARPDPALVPKGPVATPQTPVVESSRVRFEQRAATYGLDFTYLNGAQGQLLMVESIGGGAGWLDYDHDGRLDVYLTQGGDPAAPDDQPRPSDACFRQLQNGQFRDVAQVAGLIERQYGQGVACGDFDNDGFRDLYVTNVGRNSFFINNGDGTFSEVAAELGLDDSRWSTSAAWGDLDLDGDLDLYVCNYLQYDPYQPFKCEKDGQPALCHPRQLDHWPDECFENLGDGRFAARSEEWQLTGDGNKALGVAIADFSNDGWPDVYVANDTTPNFLFQNQHDKTFAESGLRLGVALSGDGAKQASMGVAVSDYDHSGSLDLYLTHFTGETNTLYQNLGEYGFQDVSGRTRIHHLTFQNLGFGAVMTDFDTDGQTDLLVANGHIDEVNADGNGYEQFPQLLTFNGATWFDTSAEAGEYFSRKYVGRAIALGDYDNDGDDDVLIVHQNKPAELLANVSEQGTWLRLRFLGTQANRDGIGTRVAVAVDGEPLPTRFELPGGTSYCASHQPHLLIPLPESAGSTTLSIHWPGGSTQELHIDNQYNRLLTVVEGRGVLD